MAVINFKTLLSAFNEKGTLLKWLQKIEAALATSVLTDVTATTSAGAAVFSFNFADGTKIETPPVILPQGEPGTPGVDGRSIIGIVAEDSYVAGDDTITPITVTFNEGNPETFSVKAKNGAAAAAGKDGVGILSITDGTPTETPEYTETPIYITLTDGTPTETFNIRAKNGTDGVGIETVHALRHYQQNGETITVCEAVLTNGETSQFEVHAQNGTRLYRHIITAQGGGSIQEFKFSILSSRSEPYTNSNQFPDPSYPVTTITSSNEIVALVVQGNTVVGINEGGSRFRNQITSISDIVEEI